MDKPTYKLVGAPCGQHGQYTFYKALRISGKQEKIIAIGDFFFVRVWQDSELVSIGELQLLWTDRGADQTLVSLRLYFLPENTPDGRNGNGQDEVLAINDKVVLRADDLLTWISNGEGWRWGLRAVWRGDCAPSTDLITTTPLHYTKLDFTDVDQEKNSLSQDESSPGVVVFSYPRYCRYRALLSRLEGTQGDWLRQSLLAALGGYAAPTANTRILYCKDTFEYPELEGHEFVCNHLAPKMKGRPRGRRRRRARSQSSSSSESDVTTQQHSTPNRRCSIRNGKTSEDEESSRDENVALDKQFMKELRAFYRQRNEPFVMDLCNKQFSLRNLWSAVEVRGGHAQVSAARGWRGLRGALRGAGVRAVYERYLLPYENHLRRNGSKHLENGKNDPIDTIEVTDSPLRETKTKLEIPEKKLRTPSPELYDPSNLLGYNPEVKSEKVKSDKVKVLVKPEEKIDTKLKLVSAVHTKLNVLKRLMDCNSEVLDVARKFGVSDFGVLLEDLTNGRMLSEDSIGFLNELVLKFGLGQESKVPDTTICPVTSVNLSVTNGYQDSENSDQKIAFRPAGRSSLRSVRVKPARSQLPIHNVQTSVTPMRPDSASLSPPVSSTTQTHTNFGINYPRNQVSSTNQENSDDEIVEVPYKPKSPEIIDLDEYPESPQTIKKKKLDILKERGLEVTAIPAEWPQVPIVPNIVPNPMLLNPAVQHQIMTQAQMFQMYNIMPNYANGVPPPKVIQGKSIFGTSGPEKTVYGNPKDPFMPPPHILQGTPIKPAKIAPTQSPQDILDLTCKTTGHKPAVEIVRVPNVQSPSKNAPQNLSAKNYTLVDGKAVVGSNLEITLVSPKPQSPVKKLMMKRSSNGQFVSTKTPTPPKDKYIQKDRKPNIVVPNYPMRDEPSPTGSSSSRESQCNFQNSLLNAYKTNNLAQIMEMQKHSGISPFMEPMYMSALYSSLAGQVDQRQLALYRDLVAHQMRGYSGLVNMATPTTKN